MNTCQRIIFKSDKGKSKSIYEIIIELDYITIYQNINPHPNLFGWIQIILYISDPTNFNYVIISL